jgi:hypothetical protein
MYPEPLIVCAMLSEKSGTAGLQASFHACVYKAIVPNATLLEGRPGFKRLMSLERRLRCGKCGARGKDSLEVEFRPRD